MQKPARHTTVELTIDRYTHADLSDLASSVHGMMPLPAAEVSRPNSVLPGRPVQPADTISEVVRNQRRRHQLQTIEGA